VCSVTAALKIALYLRVVRPWHSRWGARDEEVDRPMPGDDIIPEAHSTTRAISVACPPEELWRWLVQIGYGRGGWYSYDWFLMEQKMLRTLRDRAGGHAAHAVVAEGLEVH
jgi:hypothetical protein